MTAYFDSNATTRLAPEALEAMLPYLGESFGNPSAFCRFGRALLDPMENARIELAHLLEADPSEIIFTSCGTESNNMAIKGAVGLRPDRNRIVTSAVEHQAVLEPLAFLQREGIEVSTVPVDGQGRLDLDALESALDEDVALVSVMMANNETGVIYPLREVAELAHESGALFHTDAVQAVGKIPVSVRETDADMLSVSAHKLHGPKGVGAIYIRGDIDLPPLIHGGHHECGLRAGTYNVPGIVGLGRAVELAASEMDEQRRRLAAMRTRIEQTILEECPGSSVLATEVPRLPNTICAVFEGVESEAVLTMLDMSGICASSGSACSTGRSEPSHVLRAMGLGDALANSALRISFDRYTTEGDEKLLRTRLPEIIEKLRAVSPYA
jgi:cysteine desulfurase